MNEFTDVPRTLFDKTPGIKPPVPTFKHAVGEKPVSEHRDIALSHRILSNSGDVALTSIEGFDWRTAEALNGEKTLWQFEPIDPGTRFGTERWVKILSEGDPVYFKCHQKSDEKQLWSFIESEAKSKEVLERFGQIDLKNLTPYQALFLTTDIIKKRMKYDKAASLFVGYDNEELDNLPKDKAAIRKKNRDKSYNRYKELNNMTAEQLLKDGRAVCIHFSAISSHLYELLKERQEGLGLNGSYLLIWNEGGRATKASLDSNMAEDHAQNLLVITKPTQQGQPKIEVGVIDYTTSLVFSDHEEGETAELAQFKNEVSMDQTFLSMSSAIAMIKNYGSQFGLVNQKGEAKSLADNTLARVGKRADEFIENFGYGAGTNLFSSLVALSSSRDRGTVIPDIAEGVHKSILLAEDMYHIPALSANRNRTRLIKREYVRQYSDFLDQLNFKFSGMDTRREEASELLDLMIKQYHYGYLNNRNRLTQFFKESNYDYLLKQIVRLWPELADKAKSQEFYQTKPGHDFVMEINQGIKISKRAHKDIFSPELTENFNNLFK